MKTYSSQEYLNELIIKIPCLKSDITVAESLYKISAELLEKNEFSSCTADILKCICSIFSNMRNAVRIKNNNILNILLGAVKTIRTVISNDNGEAEELIFLKQRISIASQMIDGYIEYPDYLKEKNNSNQDDFKKFPKQKVDLQSIVSDFSRGSIKTLRIETDKLDKLCENLAEIGNISKLSQREFCKIEEIAVSFSSKIFEFEKIFAKFKSKIEENINNSYLCEEIAQAEQNLQEIQTLTALFETIKTEREKIAKDFSKHYSQLIKSIQNIRNLRLGVILHIFPRMVRDIARIEKKEVEIEITGGETSVDKKILEEIKMPLLHLLRNAVDHGIETPDVREKLGKSRAGKISVSAKNYQNKVIISVKDDGQGIDIEKIKEKAEHLFKRNEMDSFNQKDFLNMIFRPGFSTEDKVTEISGRGIGMDIVYTKITELNGKISINTEKGKGLEVIMEIPSVYKNYIPQKDDKKPVNIMIVDDSKITKMYLKNVLTKAGFNIFASDNAKNALKELENNQYDLIISDIEMPEMNGVDFVSNFRKISQEVPILIISMLPIQKASLLFENIKVNALLNKSDLNEKILVDTINQLLKN